MWASDRDLLAIEPGVFRDVLWTGQQLMSGVVNIGAAGIVTLPGPLPVASGVVAGLVMLLRTRACEVVGSTGATTISVSLARVSAGDAAIPPPVETGVAASIVSFRPQIALVHRQLLGMLGLRDAGSINDGRPSEDDVTNPDELVTLEALGALHAVYSAAAALSGDASPAGQRAAHFAQRYAQERWRASAMIDCDADGLPDAVRRFNTVRLARA